MERFGRPPDLPPELLANWAAEGQQMLVLDSLLRERERGCCLSGLGRLANLPRPNPSADSTSWACDAASSFPTRPPFGLRALLERLFRAFVHSTSGAAKDASLVPSASQLAQLVKATCDAARSHLAPTSQVAEVTDERAVIDAIDREPVMSFVADMVWVLDSEQGEWERPTQQNNIKDPAKALETYKKEIGLQRLKLVELVKELAVGSDRGTDDFLSRHFGSTLFRLSWIPFFLSINLSIVRLVTKRGLSVALQTSPGTRTPFLLWTLAFGYPLCRRLSTQNRP